MEAERPHSSEPPSRDRDEGAPSSVRNATSRALQTRERRPSSACTQLRSGGLRPVQACRAPWQSALCDAVREADAARCPVTLSSRLDSGETRLISASSIRTPGSPPCNCVQGRTQRHLLRSPDPTETESLISCAGVVRRSLMSGSVQLAVRAQSRFGARLPVPRAPTRVSHR
jgi:hypothetical protein